MADTIKKVVIEVDTGNSVKELNDVKDALQDTKKSLKEVEKTNLGNFSQQLGGLKEKFMAGEIGAGGLAKGIIGVGKAMIMAFITNPILLAIGAIVAGIMLLVSIFKDFEPLIEKIEQSFAAMVAVWNVLKTTIVGLVTGNKSLKESFNGLGTSMKNAAEEAIKLKKAEQDLEDVALQLSISNKKAQVEIDRLLLQSKDRSKTDKERIALIEQAMKLEKEQFEKNVAYADEASRIAFGKLINGKNLTEQELEDLKDVGSARSMAVMNQKLMDKSLLKSYTDTLITKMDLEQQSMALTEKAMNRKNVLEDNAAADAQKRSDDRAAQKEKDDAQKKIDAQKRSDDRAAQKEKDDAQKKIDDEKQKADQEKELAFIIQLSQTEWDAHKKKMDFEAERITNLDERFEKQKQNLILQEEGDRRLLENEMKNLEVGSERYREIQQELLLMKEDYNQKVIVMDETEAERKLKAEEKATQDKKDKDAKDLQDYKDNVDKKAEYAQMSLDSLMAIDQIATNTQLALLNQRLNDGKISQEQYEKDVAEIKKKAAKREKAYAISSTIINTAASIVKTGAELGYPAAIPFQIAAGLVGAAQIAKILATPIDGSGGGSGGSGGGSSPTTTGTAPSTSFSFSPNNPTPTPAPMKTYVIGKDVNTQQQLDRQIIANGTI